MVFLFINNTLTNPESLVETEIVGYRGRTLFHHWECILSYDRVTANIKKMSDPFILNDLASFKSKSS